MLNFSTIHNSSFRVNLRLCLALFVVITLGSGTAWADLSFDLVGADPTLTKAVFTVSGGTPTANGYQVAAGGTLRISSSLSSVYVNTFRYTFASADKVGGSPTVDCENNPYGSNNPYTLNGLTGVWNTWYRNGSYFDLEVTAEAVITSITIESGMVYDVQFSANGGQGETFTMPAAVGMTLTMPDCPFTKVGYTFRGWGPWQNYGSPIAAGGTYTINNYEKVFYAHWQQNGDGSPTQVYLNSGGYGIWDAEDVSFSVKTWKEGHKDQSQEIQMSPVEGYCYVYSALLPAGYNRLQFLRKGTAGTHYSPDDLSAPTGPENMMYDVYWWDGTDITSSQWNWLYKPSPKVWLYNNYNDDDRTEKSTSGCGNSYTIVANPFERDGFEFVGWNTQPDGSGTSYTDQSTVENVTNNLSLYAQWREIDRWYLKGSWDGWATPTVFEDNEAEVHLTENATFKIVHQKGTAETWWGLKDKTSYMESGNCTDWWLNNSEGGAPDCGITVSESGNYRFVVNTSGSSPVVSVIYPGARYTISYDANGGSGSMAQQTDLTYAQNVVLTTNTLTHSTKVFAGWNTAADGSGLNYADADRITVKGAVTLYAMWSDGLVGIKNTLASHSNSATEELLQTVDHIRVEKQLGVSTTFRQWSGTGGDDPAKKEVYFSPRKSKLYTQTVYRIEQAKTAFADGAYIGYSVRVDNGYHYNLTRLIASFATSADLTWKVQIESGNGTVLYKSSSLQVTDYSGQNRDNDRFVQSLSQEAAVQNLSGTFYVKVFFYFNGTAKYFCFPELLIDGTVVQDETCPNYDFRYKDSYNNWHSKNCFAPDPTDANTYFTEEMALPVAVSYNVGWQGGNATDGSGNNLTVEKDFSYMPCGTGNAWTLGNSNGYSHPAEGNLGGALGRFRIYNNSTSENKYVSFYPSAYTLQFGSGETWVNDKTLEIKPKSSAIEEVEWHTAIVEVSAAELAKQVWVGLKTSTNPGYVWMTKSQKQNLSGLQTKTGSTGWVDGGLVNSPNKRGRFRIYSNSTASNLYLTFVPYYHVEYSKNTSDEVTGTMNWSPEISCEGTDAERTIHAPECDYVRHGYTFTHWNTQADGQGTTYNVGDEVVMTANLTLYAQWQPVETYITLDANFHGTNGYTIHRYGQHKNYGYENVTPSAGYAIEGYYTEREGGVKVLKTDGLIPGVVVNGEQWTDNAEYVHWMHPVPALTLYAHYTTTSVCKTFGNGQDINLDKKNTLCGGANIYTNGLAMTNEGAVTFATMSTADYINISDANGISEVSLHIKAATNPGFLFARYSEDGQNWTHIERLTITAADYADYSLAVPANTYYVQLQHTGTVDLKLKSVCVLEGESTLQAPDIKWTSAPKVGVVGVNTLQVVATASMPAGSAATVSVTGYSSSKPEVATVNAERYLQRLSAGSASIFAEATVNYGSAAVPNNHVFVLESDPFSVYGADGACRDITMMWKNANLYDGTTKTGQYSYIYRPADYFGGYFTLSYEQGLGVSPTDAYRAQETEGSALNTGKYVGNAILFTIRPVTAEPLNYGDRRMSEVRFYGKQEAGDFEYTIDGENWYTYNNGQETTVGQTVSFSDERVTITKTPQSGKSVTGQDAWHTILLPENTRVFGLRNAGAQSGATHKGAWIRNMCITVCGFTDVECDAPMIQPTSPLYVEQTEDEPFITLSVSDAGEGVTYQWYRTNYQGSPLVTMPEIPLSYLQAIDPGIKEAPGYIYRLPLTYVERRGTIYFVCYATSACGATKHSAVFTRVVHPADPVVTYTLEPSAPNGESLTILNTDIKADQHIASVQTGMFYKFSNNTPNNNGAVGGMTAKIPIKNKEQNKYWDFTSFDYTIEPGYQMTVSRICLEVQPVSYSSYLFQAELFDGNGHRIVGSLSHPEPGIGSMLVFQYDNTVKLEGTVTLQLSAWDPMLHSDAAYRLGTKVLIYGSVEPLPAPQLTWLVAPRNGTEGDAPYQVVAQPSNTTREVTYSSANEDIASVDSDGTLHYHNAGRVEIRATVEGDGISSSGSTTIVRTIIVDAAVTTGSCTEPNIVISSPSHLEQASETLYNVKFCRYGSQFEEWTGITITDNHTLATNEVRLIQLFLQNEEVAHYEGIGNSLQYKPTKGGLYRAAVTIYNLVDQRLTQVSQEKNVQLRLVEAPQQPTITTLTTVEQGQELSMTAYSEGASSYQWFLNRPGGATQPIEGATSQLYVWKPTPADPTGIYSFSCQTSSSNRVSVEEDCSLSPRSEAVAITLHAASGCDWHWGVSATDASANYVEQCQHLQIISGGESYSYTEPIGSEQVASLEDQYITLTYATPQLVQPAISFSFLPHTSGTCYLFAYPNWGSATIVGKKTPLGGGEPIDLGVIGKLQGGWGIVQCPLEGDATGYIYTFTTQESNSPIQVAMCAASVCHELVEGLDIPVLEATNNGGCGSVHLAVTYHTEGAAIHWYEGTAPTAPIAAYEGKTEVEIDHNGTFWVTSTKEDKITMSKLVQVSVGQAPTFVGPQLTDFEGEIGRTYTITANFENAETFQWFRCDDKSDERTNSVAVPGAIATSLTLSLSAANTGELFYYCCGKNSCGIDLTNTFRLLVVQPTLESCVEQGTFDEQYIDLNNAAAKWNSTNKNYEVLNTQPVQIAANEGYVITAVSYKLWSSASGDALNYAFGRSSGTTYLAADYTWETRSAIGTAKPNSKTQIVYSPNAGVHSIWITCAEGDEGNSSGTRYISDLCVTVERECLDASLRFDGLDDGPLYTHTRTWGDDTAWPLLKNGYGLTVSYSSSNTMVATVDPATGVITPVSSGSTYITVYAEEQQVASARYCETAVRYQLIINEPAESHNPVLFYDEATNTLSLKNGDADYPAGEATASWYMESTPVRYATNALTLHPKVSGNFQALVTYNGFSKWSDSYTVLGMGGVPVVEKLSPFQYYRKDCEYTAGTDNPIRHIFRVSPRGTGVKEGVAVAPWRATAHKYGSEDRDLDQGSVNQWVKPDATDPNMVLFDLKALATRMKQVNFLQIGDSMVISVTPRAMDNDFDDEFTGRITVYVVEKNRRSLAYIVSGGEKSDVVLAGPFLTGYNKYDLKTQTSKTSWTNETTPLFTQLSSEFDVTPVNGYAFNDLSGVKLYQYEPFDLVLLTDYPKTDATVKGVKDASAPYVNALAALVDYRPVLSLKAHMAKATLKAWQTKGFYALPYTPKESATAMNVLCSSHEMFQQMPEEQRPTTANPLLSIVQEGGGFDNGKALQGFRMSDMQGFLNIATICTGGEPSTLSGSTINEPLVACCERQNNINARLVVLSVNAHATSLLSANGRSAIGAIMKYLLYDDPVKVADCGFEFDNASADGLWETEGNWAPYYNSVPAKGTNVRITENCVLASVTPTLGLVTIEPGKHLTLQPTAALSVLGGVKQGYKTENTFISSPDMLCLKSSASGNAALIHSDKEGNTKATVEMYSLARHENEVWYWQWITTPFHDENDVQYNYYNSWMRHWPNGLKAWEDMSNGSSMTPFDGYEITREQQQTYWMQGTLVATADVVKEATWVGNRNYLFGNSWTAPIRISAFEDSDFENLQQTFIFFNAGTNNTGTAVGAQGSGSAGTYVSVPRLQAEELGHQTIPTMQAFQLKGLKSTQSPTSSGKVSLSLSYDRLVRAASPVIEPMRAPSRAATSELLNGNTAKLVITVESENGSDCTYLFANPFTTDDFDNGWDGVKILGAADVPQICVTNAGGNWAVNTQPDIVGTTLAFRKGTADDYTVRFNYVGSETLYLYDAETGTYTSILPEATYSFASSATALTARFIITSYNPNTPGLATGIEVVGSDDSGMGNDGADRSSAKKIFLEDKLFILVNGRLFDATGRLVD